MTEERQRAPGLYGALGVAPSATPREIELAFRGWRERVAVGRASVAAFRRAESAYYTLAAAEGRARHDRQLGLVGHPAWRAWSARRAARCVRRALQELGCGRAAQARALLEEAVAHDPDDAFARSYLAVALARSGGDLHAAARHGRHAVERRPREPSFLFNLAEVYATAGFRSRAFAVRARGWRAVAASLFRARQV